MCVISLIARQSAIHSIQLIPYHSLWIFGSSLWKPLLSYLRIVQRSVSVQKSLRAIDFVDVSIMNHLSVLETPVASARSIHMNRSAREEDGLIAFKEWKDMIL